MRHLNDRRPHWTSLSERLAKCIYRSFAFAYRIADALHVGIGRLATTDDDNTRASQLAIEQCERVDYD